MRKLANRMQFGVPEESSLGNFTRFHLSWSDLHFAIHFFAACIHIYYCEYAVIIIIIVIYIYYIKNIGN